MALRIIKQAIIYTNWGGNACNKRVKLTALSTPKLTRWSGFRGEFGGHSFYLSVERCSDEWVRQLYPGSSLVAFLWKPELTDSVTILGSLITIGTLELQNHIDQVSMLSHQTPHVSNCHSEQHQNYSQDLNSVMRYLVAHSIMRAKYVSFQ